MLHGKLLPAIVLFGIASFVYSYLLPSSYYVDTDFARDLFRIWEIVQGDIAFIGPPLSVGAFAGPYYYYLQIPLLLFSKFNESALLYFNVGLFSISSALTYFIFNSRFSKLSSFIAALSISIMPFWIIAARRPGNAFTHLPLILLVILLIIFKTKYSKINLIALGFLTGIILNFHPTAAYALIIVGAVLFLKLKTKKLLLLFLISLGVTYIPLMAFEVKSGFSITKNVFINSQFNDISKLAPTIYHTSAKENPIENFVFLVDKSKDQLGFSIVWLWIIAVPLLFMAKGLSGKITILGGISSFILVAVSARFLYEPHYLLPSLLLTSITVAVLLARSYWGLGFLLIFAIAASFPTHLYQPSPRSLERFAAISKSVIDQGALSHNETFNLVELIEENHYVPAGHIYRFHFSKSGYKPLGLLEYPTANKLLIFNDVPNQDINNVSFWEIDQFDKNTKKEIIIPNQPTQVYRLTSKTYSQPK